VGAALSVRQESAARLASVGLLGVKLLAVPAIAWLAARTLGLEGCISMWW
jgi:predicted permease